MSFSFFTQEEIRRLSVVKVDNTQTFDHLDNPKENGLHDKRMGVSPFDRASSCMTCGLTSNFCPGHHGHIELVAPLYNPFMIKEMYRLMKAKCFHCHRLRIPDAKIAILTNALKFIKAGEIIGSQRIKAHFLAIAREVASAKVDDAGDSKRVAKIKSVVNRMLGSDSRSRTSDDGVKEELTHFARRYNIEREKFEHEILGLLEDLEQNEDPEKTNKIENSG